MRGASLQIFVEELDGARHGQAEWAGQVVVVAGIRIQLHGLPGSLGLIRQGLRKGIRHFRIIEVVMELERAGQVAQEGGGRNRVPKLGVLGGGAVLLEPGAPALA